MQNDPAEERRQRRRKEEESRHSRADQMENRQAAKDVEKEQVAIKGMLIITLFILRNQITLYHL